MPAVEIVGFIIAICMIPMVRRSIVKRLRLLRNRWIGRSGKTLDVIARIRNGSYTGVSDDFFIMRWDHEVGIDEHGDTETIIKCEIVNKHRDEKPQTSIEFPLYFADNSQELECLVQYGSDEKQPAKIAIEIETGKSKHWLNHIVTHLLEGREVLVAATNKETYNKIIQKLKRIGFYPHKKIRVIIPKI